MNTDSGSFFEPATISLISHYGAANEWARRTLDDEHVQQVDDTRVLERLEDLDLPQRRDGHALLLVVHQDALQRYMAPGRDL
jgi:hypothetical protein